jgi:hypothetical protein
MAAPFQVFPSPSPSEETKEQIFNIASGIALEYAQNFFGHRGTPGMQSIKAIPTRRRPFGMPWLLSVHVWVHQLTSSTRFATRWLNTQTLTSKSTSKM